MRQKHFIACFLVLTFVFWGVSKGKAVSRESIKSENQINLQDSLLSQEEQQVLYWINLVRTDPSGFYKKYLMDYISSTPRFTKEYTESLKEEMLNSPILNPYETSLTMKTTATYLAKDLVAFKGKRLDHTTSTGKTFEERMKGTGLACVAENIYTGDKRTPQQVVMDLLVDQGVKTFGHRKNLLSNQYKKIGISLLHYSPTGFVVVIDFSC